MSSAERKDGRFPTTSWTLVVAAGQPDASNSRDALAELCRLYWFPLYAYVRRQGFDVDKAQDLTQGFFARLLDKHYIDDARHDRGRFRSFLLTSLKHYMANERDREQALKRGGSTNSPIFFSSRRRHTRYAREPGHDLT